MLPLKYLERCCARVASGSESAGTIGPVVKEYLEAAMGSLTKTAANSAAELKKMSANLSQLTNRTEKTTSRPSLDANVTHGMRLV